MHFRKFLSSLVFIVLSACSTFSSGRGTDGYYEAGDHEFSLRVDGLDRRVLVHVPASYRSFVPHPIVFALHGGGGNADGSVEYFELNELADQEGFIAAYPEGTGRRVFGKLFGSWNAGRCCAPALDQGVDDVGYFEAVIELLDRNFNIDQDRVYVMGMSNGAQMSYRLACEIADKIAAIAASGSTGSYEPCIPTRPVPVLHIQGRLDPCSPYQGGQCGGCMADLLTKLGFTVEKRLWTCGSVPDYLQQWSRLNQCRGEAQQWNENRSAQCVSYDRCENGAEVVLCTVEGMGHTWAGRSSYAADACVRNPEGDVCNTWIEIVGPLGEGFPANETIWAFFERHPRR